MAGKNESWERENESNDVRKEIAPQLRKRRKKETKYTKTCTRKAWKLADPSVMRGESSLSKEKKGGASRLSLNRPLEPGT